MRNIVNIVVGIVLLLMVSFGPGNILASQQKNASQTAGAIIKQNSPTVPNLTEIIPLSVNLSGSLANLRNNLKQIGDFSDVEKTFDAVSADVDKYIHKYNELKEIDSYNVAKIYELTRSVTNKKYLLEEVSKPLIDQIRQIDGWKSQWLEEKKKWNSWQSFLLKDQTAPEELTLVFNKALGIISTALNLTTQHLEDLLVLNGKGGDVAGKISVFEADLLNEIANVRQENLYSKAPPLFSFAFLSQFKSGLWSAVYNDLQLVSWSGFHFFIQHGLIALLELSFVLALIAVIHSNREALKESERWKFLAERPVSSALFINILTVALFVAYSPYSDVLRLTNIIIGGIATMRVLGLVLVQSWRKQAIYFLMIVYIFSEISLSVGLPNPVARLYIFLVSLTALYLLMRWTKQCVSLNEASIHIWLLRTAQALFVVIIITELWGNDGISAYLFKSTLRSLANLLPYMFFMYMIYGGLYWVFHASPVWQVKLLRSDADSLVQKTGLLFMAAIIYLILLPMILASWNVYDNVLDATASINSYELSIGSLHLMVGTIAISIAIFYCSILTSRILPKVLLDETVTGRKLARGAQRSIGQLIRYCIIFVGFLLTLSLLGFEFSQLTIVLSAFGVGIGFGLQGIVNNFFCGLILLFERPLTEGDTIEIGTSRAHIRKIGLRSTIVTTLDMADLIIPNADLINNQVTNWTLTNREVRLCVPVGVAYGSNVALVVETLQACAKEQQEVLKSPVPEVLFLELGDSSLNFELRVWIQDVDRRRQVTSALYLMIESKFREAKIVVPFPQRDVHFPDCEGVARLPVVSNTPETGDL
jgi:potassium-dependent mechanosensitive channel